MLKAARFAGAWGIITLALASCSSNTPGEPPSAPAMVSPEADITAPGMIPGECESLLQKSEAWGYHPGEKWAPSSEAQALEVAQFFAGFALVPFTSAQFYNGWLESSDGSTEEAAKARVENFNKAQVCDANLSLALMEGLLDFRWKADTKKQVRSAVLKFLLNQQARTSPIISRAVSLRVAEKAKSRGLLGGGSLKGMQAKLAKRKPLTGTEGFVEQQAAIREELQLSEEVRVELSRHLPLP